LHERQGPPPGRHPALVRERRISTQEELVSALGAAGHEVADDRIRDVHELG
jgi:arginine repressor